MVEGPAKVIINKIHEHNWKHNRASSKELQDSIIEPFWTIIHQTLSIMRQIIRIQYNFILRTGKTSPEEAKQLEMLSFRLAMVSWNVVMSV